MLWAGCILTSTTLMTRSAGAQPTQLAVAPAPAKAGVHAAAPTAPLVPPAGPDAYLTTPTPPLAPSVAQLAGEGVSSAQVEGIVWALAANCASGSAVEDRQCKQVRDTRRRAITKQRLKTLLEASALQIDAYDPKTRSRRWQLRGCVACDGIVVDDQRYAVWAGPPVLLDATGATIVAPVTTPLRKNATRTRTPKPPPAPVVAQVAVPVLASGAQVFRDEASSDRWLAQLRAARAELYFEINESPVWQHVDQRGVRLDVLGFRVWTPCTGVVYMASDGSTSAPPEQDARCSTATPSATALQLPERDREEISRVMSTARMLIEACPRQPGVAGVARLRMTVESDGTISRYEQSDTFAGTDLGKCIDEAAQRVKFPAGRQRATFVYPVVLR